MKKHSGEWALVNVTITFKDKSTELFFFPANKIGVEFFEISVFVELFTEMEQKLLCFRYAFQKKKTFQYRLIESKS